MKVIRRKQMASAKEMKVGDVEVVRFDTYSQYRSFSVQLSGYNARYGREKNLFIHAACDLNGFQYCLVAISSEEYARFALLVHSAPAKCFAFLHHFVHRTCPFIPASPPSA